MKQLDLIVKDGTVSIPSIFMFDHYDEVVTFVKNARQQNCVVVFENERVTISSGMSDSDVNYKLLNYASIITNHEIGISYCRYLANLKNMTWDTVK